jgi:prepilin-type N-terminal cleavage/methylation domain-containing protein
LELLVVIAIISILAGLYPGESSGVVYEHRLSRRLSKENMSMTTIPIAIVGDFDPSKQTHITTNFET